MPRPSGARRAFVGRERELALLADAWERALAGERCELVTVVGDAGVGKSRLVAEALARSGRAVVRGRCLAYGEGITYWPVVEVVKQLDALPSDPAAAAAIRSLLGESEAATSAEEIAWAFRKLLEEQAPLVVVFDDIQWGEETFLDLVEHVALLSPVRRSCCSAWRGRSCSSAARLAGAAAARALTSEEADALIGDALPAELRERSRARPAGIRSSSRDALDAREEDVEVAVPPTLRRCWLRGSTSSIRADRRVLERGAVEGEIFHRGAVQALARKRPR